MLRCYYSVVSAWILVQGAAEQLLKGVSYGPVPLKYQGSSIPVDDFMSDYAKPLWGKRGRDDLGIIKALGANIIRMYGNDPKMQHADFLNAAHSEGLLVVAGQSDYPFIQMEGNCLHTDFNCYSQVKPLWAENLQNGFLLDDKTYHPALHHVIVVNEPDLKLPPPPGGKPDPKGFCKAVISAIDAMVSAEKEAGVKNALLKFTATFSFADCTECAQGQQSAGKPALRQMLSLRDAMENPAAFGYQPQNDLKEVYRTRFLNSFNTQNPSTEMQNLILTSYGLNFQNTPVFIEEFHSYYTPVDSDLRNMLQIASSMPLLLGASFFEFQVRADKGAEETLFGMFKLGDYQLGSMTFGLGQEYPVWCLQPALDPKTSRPLPQEVLEAYGGQGLNFETLCKPDANKVPLNTHGFSLIQGRTSAKEAFLRRAIEGSGGEVTDAAALQGFARDVTSFQGIVDGLRSHPALASWDPYAACVADRSSNGAAQGKILEEVCLKTWFQCSSIPKQCQGSVWQKADYVLSVYYWQVGGDPLTNCYYDGAATFVPSAVYRDWDSTCVVTKNPTTTPLTDEGYQAILSLKNDALTEVFFDRVIRHELGASVKDMAMLKAFSATPPSSMYDVRRLLSGAAWVCAGSTGRSCSASANDALAWRKYAFISIGVLVVLALLGTASYVMCFRGSSTFSEWFGKQTSPKKLVSDVSSSDGE